MPWMDAKLRRATQQAVRKHCANFSGVDGCVIAGTCLYFRELLRGQESYRCDWAEKGVIPNEPAVDAMYTQKLNRYLCVHGGDTQSNNRRCSECGKPFLRGGNRQTRCSACKAKARRNSLTMAQRRYRRSKQG